MKDTVFNVRAPRTVRVDNGHPSCYSTFNFGERLFTNSSCSSTKEFISDRSLVPCSPLTGPTGSSVDWLKSVRIFSLCILWNRFQCLNSSRILSASDLKTTIELKNNPTKQSRTRFPAFKTVGNQVRHDRAPLGRRTHGEMDRFLQEVNDEAHLGAHTAGGLSHRAPAPLSQEGPNGWRTHTSRSWLHVDAERLTDFSPRYSGYLNA